MSTFIAPFNVRVGSSLVVKAGQAVPMGKLDAVVHKGHAGGGGGFETDRPVEARRRTDTWQSPARCGLTLA